MNIYRPANFMLLPVMSCQGQCVYCFGPGSTRTKKKTRNRYALLSEKLGKKNGSVMSLDIADAVIAFMESIAPKDGKVYITFHGGEPLLAPAEWYRSVLSRLKECFGRRLRLSMQTNLLALSEEMIGLIRQYDIHIGTSVDGGCKMCDVQRGKGYYEKNTAARERLYRAGVSVGSICTFTPEFADRDSVRKAFYDFSAPYSVHGAVPSLGGVPGPYHVNTEELKTVFLESYRVYRENISKNRVTTIDSMAKGCFDGKGSVCTFYDCLGVFSAIASDGSVYPCQRFCGHSGYCFGNVKDGLTEQKILESDAYARLWQAEDGTKEACGDCVHYDYCMGGCLYNRLAANQKKDPYCESYRAVFDQISYDMAMEMGGIMTTDLKKEEAVVLAMAGDLAHPYERRVNQERINRAVKAAACPGASGLPVLRVAMLEFPEKYRNKLYLHITFCCPLRCSHCYARGGERTGVDMSVETVISAIEDAKKLGFASVVITGGEPLSHSGWDELAAALSDLDRKGMRLILRTSLGFAVPKQRLRLLCETFPEIVVSIDGDKTYHDARRGEGAKNEEEFHCLDAYEAGEKPFFPQVTCGLGHNLYVEPDGSCYPCYAWCGEETYLGNLSEGLEKIVESDKFLELSCHDVDSNEKCRSCEVRYLCGGMCKAWVRDKKNIDSGDFDCKARKADMLRKFHLGGASFY